MKQETEEENKLLRIKCKDAFVNANRNRLSINK